MSEQVPTIGHIVQDTLDLQDAAAIDSRRSEIRAAARCVGEGEGRFAWPTRA